MNIIVRRSIWEVHGKRCAYCREHLAFGDLEIDHILPQSVLNHPDSWRRVRAEQDLPDDFDIDGYENLVPSCRPCNARKAAVQFAPGRCAIELSNENRLKLQVEDRVRQLSERDKLDRIRATLATSIASGQLTLEEVRQLGVEARNDTGVFRLSPQGWLFKDQPMGEVSAADEQRYLATEVTLPPDLGGSLRLVSHDRSEVRVSSLGEYRDAVARGYFAYSTFEMDVAYQYFARPLTLLEILKVARFAERSFIGEPHRGLSDLDLLPASLLFLTRDMQDADSPQRQALVGLSIQDFVRQGTATVMSVKSDVLAVEYDHWRTFLLELMRADINRDGIEEMVIHRGGGPLTGTLRTASVLALTRTTPDAMFSIVDLP